MVIQNEDDGMTKISSYDHCERVGSHLNWNSELFYDAECVTFNDHEQERLDRRSKKFSV